LGGIALTLGALALSFGSTRTLRKR
jgi:hypothetical protein